MRPPPHNAILLVAERAPRWADWLEGASRKAARVEALLQGPGEAAPSFTSRVTAAVADRAAREEAPRVVLFVTGAEWHGASLYARVEILRRLVTLLNGSGQGRIVLACDDPLDRAQIHGLRGMAVTLAEHGVARGVAVSFADDAHARLVIDAAA